jgi:hypothetical protein
MVRDHMNMLRSTLFALLLTTATMATAQMNLSGSQNVPVQGQKNWKHVGTAHFDIHYSSSDAGIALLASRYAEEALWEIGRLLDFNSRAKFALYIFLTPDDLVRSNMFPFEAVKSGGVTPIRTNTAAVLFPGSQPEFQQRVRAEVMRLLMEDFYFGGGIQASIQNTVLLHLPQWYAEGLSAYVGEGWDYQDELWLSSLERTHILNFALDGDEQIHRIARKSIWYFIATQYGKEKLAEIFYMTRLTRSVEDGIVHVLGITLKTLTERWREFVLQRITENGNFREALADQATRIRTGAHGRLLNFALNPVAPLVALQVEHHGKHSVAIYDLDKQTLRQTGVETGWKTDQFEQLDYRLPMTWSPDGKRLALVTLSEKGERMLIWDRVAGAFQATYFQPNLERILSMAWSNDGSQLVFSALRGGSIDLYRSTPGNASMVQLTNDLYDDLEPVWSGDDSRVYYASSRPNDSLDPAEPPRYDANTRALDIWEISINGKELRQVSHSPLADELPVRMLNSFELLVHTNQSGLWNLERRNVFLGDSIPQSNVVNGLAQVGYSDSLIVFSVPEKGRLVLYQASSQQFLHEVVSLKTPLRMREDKAMLAVSRATQAQVRKDSVQRVMREAELAKSKAKPDSSNSKAVKYYVFDEDGEANKTPRTNNRSRPAIIRKELPTKPDFQGLSIGNPRASGREWVTDRVITQLVFDPIFRLGMKFEARLRDQQRNDQLSIGFQPFIDFRSSDAYIRYANTARRVDWSAGFTRSTRFLNKEMFSLRSTSNRFDIGAILPLTRYTSVSGGIHAVQLSRNNLALRLPSNIDGHELLAGGRVDLTYDRVKRMDNFSQRGTFATIGIQNVASAKERYNRFATASFDLRKYFPIQHFVLATRLSGAMSVGRTPQRFFTGGTEDWLFGNFNNIADFPIADAMADFHYMQYTSAIHGFRYNARNGSRYLVANAELHIPLSRFFKSSLNANTLYNFELIPFFDLGTAWTVGNPFSQRNPIDTKVFDSYPLSITVQTLKSPFIMGFGSGVRMQVFGYSTRIDLGWGIDDYTLQKPKVQVSLGKNF